ncbi:MAG: imidazoleglycerol-phosphate dehydratase HisB [Spirochaetes bacterium]|nr:imidazoleglycerol-phosphate dehydratase HisB [Spirochaetota bacterium]
MRESTITRKTKETAVSLGINLDGKGVYTVKTPIGFFTHMLELFSKHSGVDLTLDASGDIDVDHHHTVEDTGIVLGEAVAKALGDKKGIARYADVALPMDETLVNVALDLSGRPYFVYNAELKREKVGEFDTEVVEDFFRAFSVNAKITLHINVVYGTNAHHVIEAMFKGVAVACKRAMAVVSDTIPSTKGVL